MLAVLHRFIWWLSYQFTLTNGFIVGALLSLVLPRDDGYVPTLAGNVVGFLALGVLVAVLFAFINDLIFGLVLAGVLRAPTQ